MNNHSARSHATWSASATARNVQCPGALAMSAHASPDKESIHSARGTAAHELAEICLRKGTDASGAVGLTITAKTNAVVIDEELANSAQVYVDYVRERAATGANLQLEQHFSLESLSPPFDAGGTADAVLHWPEAKKLEVVDFKNGRGIVDAESNPQLRTYALGAMLANPGLRVDRITVTIVQPRVGDGKPKSDTFRVVDLLEWTGDLVAAMEMSKQALDSFPGLEPSLKLDMWGSAWLKPGKCTFCPAEGFCPALRNGALKAAQVTFDTWDKPQIGNAADGRSPEAVAKDLDMLDMIEDWIKARRAYAHQLADAGTAIPGYQLRQTMGHRKWAADEEKVMQDLQLVVGLEEHQCYEVKLKSPSAIEKVLGAKGKDKIKNMWVKPVTGTTLVKTEKATTPPALSTVERFFEKD
jgi:hypothetical protein